jgi:superfamily I DNA/RNA helicase
MSFTPSLQQEKIFGVIAEGVEKNIVIAAGPGSGKTTTSRKAIRYMSASATIISLAFNVDAATQLGEAIALELQEMKAAGLPCPDVTSLNIHKLGTATLKKHNMEFKKVDNYKYKKLAGLWLARQYRDEYALELADDDEFQEAINTLMEKARLLLKGVYPDRVNALELEEVCKQFSKDIELNYYDLDLWALVLRLIPAITIEGITQARMERIVDFTDMIWLPVVLRMKPDQYDYVLVDECQDLNRVQLQLVLSARNPGGYFIAVGDRRQAIYAFSGASPRSIDDIIKETNAIELELSVCYRCPVSALEEVATIYDGVVPAPGAPLGITKYILPEEVQALAQAGDLILCRTTAPLVRQCLELLREGKRANVRGRDLGGIFTGLLKKIEKYTPFNARRFLDLPSYAAQYKANKIEEIANDDEAETKADAINDKHETLLALFNVYVAYFKDPSPLHPFAGYAYFPKNDKKPCDENNRGKKQEAPTLDGFKSAIKFFFSTDTKAQIILSTGHRAKGLEYPRVIILDYDKIPHPKAKTEEEKTQERNVKFVMATRVKWYRKDDGSYDENTGHMYLVVDTLPYAYIAPTPIMIEEEAAQAEQAEPIIVETAAVLVPAQVEQIAAQAEPAAPAKKWAQNRERMKWQGTYNPDFIECLQDMARDTTGKKTGASSLLERLAMENPEFAAYFDGWKAKKEQAALELHGLTDEEPEPDPNGGGAPQPAPDREAEQETAPAPSAAVEEEPVMSNYATQAEPNLPQEFKDDWAERSAAAVEPFTTWAQVLTSPSSDIDSSFFDMVEALLPVPAFTKTSAVEQTCRMFFTCSTWGKNRKPCGNVWTIDYMRNKDGKLYRETEAGAIFYEDERGMLCPACNGKFHNIRFLQAEYSDKIVCDARCMHAKTAKCKCPCGGRNHGAGMMLGTALYSGVEVPATATAIQDELVNP